MSVQTKSSGSQLKVGPNEARHQIRHVFNTTWLVEGIVLIDEIELRNYPPAVGEIIGDLLNANQKGSQDTQKGKNFIIPILTFHTITKKVINSKIENNFFVQSTSPTPLATRPCNSRNDPSTDNGFVTLH